MCAARKAPGLEASPRRFAPVSWGAGGPSPLPFLWQTKGGRRYNPFRVEKIGGRLPKVARSRNLGLNDAIPLGFQRVGGFGQARICVISFRLKIAQLFMAGLAEGRGRKSRTQDRCEQYDWLLYGCGDRRCAHPKRWRATALHDAPRGSAAIGQRASVLACGGLHRWQHASNAGVAGVTTTDGVVLVFFVVFIGRGYTAFHSVPLPSHPILILHGNVIAKNINCLSAG